MTLLEKVTDLYNLINTGKLMDGFEKYYHEDVEMQEAGDEPRKGKATNREYELKFLQSIEEFHGAGVGAITSNEEQKTTMVESWMEVTMTGMGRFKMEQVAVQHWDGDFIVREKFYHK